MTEPWFTYDSLADALGIFIHDGSSVRTLDEGNGRYVDLDAEGNVVAIEVLGVSHGFFLDDLARKYGLEVEIARLAPRLPGQFYHAAQPSKSG